MAHRYPEIAVLAQSTVKAFKQSVGCFILMAQVQTVSREIIVGRLKPNPVWYKSGKYKNRKQSVGCCILMAQVRPAISPVVWGHNPM